MNHEAKNPLSLVQYKLLQACIELKTTDTKTLANHLHRSHATVRNQFQEILGILKVHSRYAALKTAEDEGWLFPSIKPETIKVQDLIAVAQYTGTVDITNIPIEPAGEKKHSGIPAS
jgi:hypothetical protein